MRLRLAPIVPLVASLVGACSLAGPGASNPPTNPPTVSHAPTAAATAVPTAPPTAAATPTEAPEPTAELPPNGLLAADGDAVAGWLGTFCWGDTCQDVLKTAPKSTLPALTATAGMEMVFALADGTLFYEWSASYASTSNGAVTELGHGGADFDPDSSASQPPALDAIDFGAPPSGGWVVHVRVSFASGDASYAWHVTVN